LRTIAHISDLHFGRHDPSVVEALLASLDRSGCDLVVVSGDLTQRAQRHEFEQARSFLDRIALPKLVIPGNHDVPLHNPLSRFLRPLDRYDRYVSAERQPLFADEEVAVLGLSTVRRLTGKNGRVSLAQMGAIRRIFGGLPGDVFKVLVTHHPLAMPNPDDTLETVGRAEAALNAAAAAGVHLVLSGHYHRSSSGEAPAHVARKRSVLVVHAGTAVSTRTRGGEVNTYNLIRIEPHHCHLSIMVMAWAGEVGFAEVRHEPYVLREEGWRAEPGG
jgi:3',5'-cyclic AMP phosphodiesterase CpdA